MILAASILFKATMTIVLALAATRLARHARAAVRHVLLSATFAVLLALPLASLLAPSIPVPLRVRVPAPVASLQTGTDTAADTDLADLRAARSRAGAAATTTPASRRPSWPLLGGGIWALGVAIFLLPVATGLHEVRRLRRTGLPWRYGQSIVDALARDAAIRRRVELM